MDYEKVIEQINEYEVLYSLGMKQDANRVMQDLCNWLESTSPEETDILLKQRITDICETETLVFLFKRGNGQLPFQLKQMIQKWLYPRCQRSKMPELRWFYQIFKYDLNNSEYAYSFLDSAYTQSVDDPKTQELVFERNLDSLEYGMHELPIGLLISDKEAQIIFQQCDAIIQRGYAPMSMIERYSASKQEYNDYINLKDC